MTCTISFGIYSRVLIKLPSRRIDTHVLPVREMGLSSFRDPRLPRCQSSLPLKKTKVTPIKKEPGSARKHQVYDECYTLRKYRFR